MLWGAICPQLNPSTIEAVITAISQRPRGEYFMVVGNFNTNLAVPEGNARDEDISASLDTVGVEDMNSHFLPWRKPWLRDGRKWIILYGGREVHSRNDYILGTDRRLLQNLVV